MCILTKLKTATHTIKLDEVDIVYRLIKRRLHRSFTLSVHAGGRVTVTVPKRTSHDVITRFLREKKEWLREALRASKKAPYTPTVDRQHYKKHKEQARAFVLSRLATLNTHYGFTYNAVRIRMNTSRWGSCSNHGNLNFDYRILFLPKEMQDYLLVHELCHLEELNHSKRFWGLVAQTVPEYVSVRRALRKIKMM